MEKSKGEIMKEKLFYKSESAYSILSDTEIETAYKFCEGYKDYLDNGKTEREAVAEAIKILEANGFKPYEFGKKYNAGEGAYINNFNKNLLAVRFGAESADKGVNIIAAHIDSPRIDLKQRPLYEDGGFGFFKTHYYGGIKKYQWTALPLALHGVICKEDGSIVSVTIGEDEADPVFCITDLLPHLGKDQYAKNLGDAITGEGLNILIGSREYAGEDKLSEKIKLNILVLLNEKYGITEKDFLTAELSLVPSAKAKDVGFDRSMVGAYGQDDRVCAYPPIIALTEEKNIANTAIVVLSDKEEVGSEGNTGMQSHILRDLITDITQVQNVCKIAAFKNSKCLSADVNACFDPNYADVYDAKNSAYINKGVVVTKFTGTRGKSGSNDASAEFLSYIREKLDRGHVLWQTAELGKVDQGGGGTVAMYIANENIEVVDIGVPILSMHAPFEVASKTDIFMMYKASKAFIK